MATAKKTGDNLILLLKKSVSEIEDFQVQLALGKAEAHDKFEEAKKKFNSFLHSSKQKLAVTKEKKEKIRGNFDELQVQLALGKAESIELFNEQKKKIFSAISKLEKSFENKTSVFSGDVEEKIKHEIERFRIKMEVLRVQYALGKLEAAEEFEKRKHELAENITKLKARFQERRKAAAKTRQLRHKEIRDAYKHVKKTFVKA